MENGELGLFMLQINQESHRIEYKTKLTDSFEKEIVAFLNSDRGGVVYVGIDDDLNVIGCDKVDETQLKIKDKLKHNISPSCLGLFEIIIENIEDKSIIKVIVASGREKPYYIKKYGMSSKGCYVRIGSSSEPMSQEMIENLFSKRVKNSLSKIKSHRQDLTFEQLKIYYEERGLKLNDKFATNLELLTEDSYYNYVAYLLADNNGVSIKVAKYAGTNKVDLIENQEFGYCSLVKATHKVLDKLDIENKISTLITYKERIEKPLWDKVALREAVINAIVHNDYTTEIPPVFEIYSDRIEITSSGGLSTIKNIDEFFEGYSKPINRELMRVFKDLELVEHLGSGLDKILKAYDKDSFKITQNFMKNIFFMSARNIKAKEEAQEEVQEEAQEDLNETEKKILYYLQDNNLSSKELSNRLGLKSLSGSFKKAIKHLLEMNLIEYTIPEKPKSKNQKYKLKDKRK
jgi:predicted HTH transcriptional regulator